MRKKKNWEIMKNTDITAEKHLKLMFQRSTD